LSPILRLMSQYSSPRRHWISTAYIARKLTGGELVSEEEKLSFKYDREADILFISRCTPYAEQES